MCCRPEARKIGRILFVFVSIIIFIIFFGIPSVEKYFEQRTIFSEEYISYDESDEPNILLSHIKFEQSGFQSFQKPITNCFKLNKDNYNQSIQCIESVTFCKEKYIITDHSKGIFINTRTYIYIYMYNV